MNNKQIGKSLMFQRVSLAFAKFKAIFETVEPLKDSMDEFEVENDKLIPHIQQQQKGSNGTTDSKQTLKSTAINAVMVQVKKARPWARKLGNATLIELLDVTKTDFDVDELVCVAHLQNIATAIAANKADLKKYNINDAEIANTQVGITAFSNAIGTPQQQKAVVKVATENIPILLEKIDVITKDCDDLIKGNFATTHPDEVKEYREARRIGSTLGYHTTVSANIYGDAAHSQPIEGAMMSIEIIKREDESDADGLAEIVKFKGGSYTLKITAVGYANKEVKFKVKSGKKVEVDVVMVGV